MDGTRQNGQSQQEADELRELRELRERERELRVRELAAKARLDEPEIARLKLLAEFIGEAYAERIGELLDGEEGRVSRRQSGASRESSRESSREQAPQKRTFLRI